VPEKPTVENFARAFRATYGNHGGKIGKDAIPVIDVEPGKTYRFRFIGATGLSLLSMAFEDHGDLTIIQVDGSEYNAP
jgi:FtsP/CotA-like multicopper oxidase with cupredoxin domain